MRKTHPDSGASGLDLDRGDCAFRRRRRPFRLLSAGVALHGLDQLPTCGEVVAFFAELPVVLRLEHFQSWLNHRVFRNGDDV
jgi:hypothetical protein